MAQGAVTHQQPTSLQHSYATDAPTPNSNPQLPPARRTTADNASRLVAQVTWGYNNRIYNPWDSTVYSYSGQQSGYFDGNQWIWLFNNRLGYDYYATSGLYNPGFRTSQTFDANGNITLLFTEMYYLGSGTWKPWYQKISTYDTANNLVEYYDQQCDTAGTWTNKQKLIYTYTPANKVASSVSMNWNRFTSAYDNTIRLTYAYDTANNMTSEQDENWSSGAWVRSQRTNYIYDAANNMITQLFQYWDASTHTFKDQYKYNFTYDGVGNVLSLLQESIHGTVWTSDYQYINTGFAGHQPLERINQSWNSSRGAFVNLGKVTTTYNSYDQPTTVYYQQWDTTAGAWLTDTTNWDKRYYYETYVASVKEIGNQGSNNLTLFPVPAKNELTVSLTWDEAQAFAIIITDMQGRTNMTWQVAPCRTHTDKIPVDHLPPGNYTITATGAKGKMSRTFTVN
jgi:hypothetical protein